MIACCFRRKSHIPPASEIIDIACHAQQRVEASVPLPPAVSRTGSFTSLQQLVPESTRQTMEMVLSSTAQSPSKLLQLGRNVVGQKLKSQLSGLSGGWHRSAPVIDGAVYYKPTDSPSPGGSSEQLTLAAPQPTEPTDVASCLTGSHTDINNDANNTKTTGCEQVDDPTTEVNLIDLSFEESGNSLVVTSSDDNQGTLIDIEFTDGSAVNLEKTSDNEPTVTDELPENTSATNASNGSCELPAILLNDTETSGVRADRPLCRRHSLLKMSHSDSSISMSLSTPPPPAPQGATSAGDLHAMRELDMVDDDDADFASTVTSSVSGFSRLLQGGKLAASLMVPRGTGMSAAAAASRRRQLEELAKSRLAKSQVRFKECRTRIILL